MSEIRVFITFFSNLENLRWIFGMKWEASDKKISLSPKQKYYLVVLAGRLAPAATVAADRGRLTRTSCRFEVAFGNRAESHISQRSLPAAFSKVQAKN